MDNGLMKSFQEVVESKVVRLDGDFLPFLKAHDCGRLRPQPYSPIV